MTDAEKIKHHDTITDIRERIGGCFGTADGIFAGHPFDEERAKEHRKSAADNGISLAEMQDIILGYLYRKGYIAEHIKKQFDKATKFFAKKLN